MERKILIIIILLLLIMAGIVHVAVKVHGEKGLATEWNADHKITGDVDFDSNKIINLKDPTLAQDAATKKYVDDSVVTIVEIYTGGGFNSSVVNAIQVAAHEMDAVDSTDAGHVRIIITGTSKCKGGNADESYVELKAQIKETGGAYGDIISYKRMVYSGTNGPQLETTPSYIITHTLTAGQKTNGFRVAVFSKSFGGGAAGSASFTNVQTIQELMK